MTILKALPVLYCSFPIGLKAVGEVAEIINNYKKKKKKKRYRRIKIYIGFKSVDISYTVTALYVSCYVFSAV